MEMAIEIKHTVDYLLTKKVLAVSRKDEEM
jgi:hypothetical protein